MKLPKIQSSFKAVIALFRNSRIANDSFWAVFGNGIGYGLMLLAGIVIARILGSEQYGEYGMVKTTMFNIATLATFALNFTCTRYIARYLEEKPYYIRSVCSASIRITIATSTICAIALAIFAGKIAIYLGDIAYAMPLRFLAIIVIFRALATTQYGMLAGFGMFKTTSRNNFISGLILLVCGSLLSFYIGLAGALIALLLSQFFNFIINYYSLKKPLRELPGYEKWKCTRDLIKFSAPLAVQEIGFNVCSLAIVVFLTKFASISEYGIYVAAYQWYIIMVFFPSLLNNVVLRHLSGAMKDHTSHMRKFKRLLLITISTATVTAAIICAFSPLIGKIYGVTFIGLTPVIILLSIVSIFSTSTYVLKSELIAIGKVWQLCVISTLRGVFMIFAAYYMITGNLDISAAMGAACAFGSAEFTYSILLGIYNYVILRQKT